jgi:poly(hydroxyalkanoate) depolymerase family esterase
MSSLGKTLLSLSRYRKRWAAFTSTQAAAHQPAPLGSHLRETRVFGSNPGNLRMLLHIPAQLPQKPALVVILHGCDQTAAGYDHGAGWSAQADTHGFIVLYPEQSRSNNAKQCFTWFAAGDIRRDHGEALSIREMIATAVTAHGIDEQRIFVTGLSAGGAMTAVMLAAYPEVFAGGAVIAGLPYGAALTVADALGAMFKGKELTARARGDAVRSASAHAGPWPRVSIWHGSADTTVKPVNAGELVKQWTSVHGIAQKKPAASTIGDTRLRTWTGPDGKAAVSEYLVPGLGHAVPINPSHDGARGEHVSPHFTDTGLSSTAHILRDWELAPAEGAARPATKTAAVPKAQPSAAALPDKTPPRPAAKPESRRPARAGDIESVIVKALKSAGLMR